MAKHCAAPNGPSVVFRVGDVLVNITAVVGTVCIVATIAALLFGVNIAMFKTGSMAPTIPTGSAAVSVRIDAADARPRDIVTVSRGKGKLPVTHRVVEVMPTGDGEAALILKGDANDSNDPFPYQVQTVNRVVWSMPGLGTALARAQQAPLLGVVTVFAALLVTWAFWPRKCDDDEAGAGSHGSAAAPDSPIDSPRPAATPELSTTDHSFAVHAAGSTVERPSL